MLYPNERFSFDFMSDVPVAALVDSITFVGADFYTAKRVLKVGPSAAAAIFVEPQMMAPAAYPSAQSMEGVCRVVSSLTMEIASSANYTYDLEWSRDNGANWFTWPAMQTLAIGLAEPADAGAGMLWHTSVFPADAFRTNGLTVNDLPRCRHKINTSQSATVVTSGITMLLPPLTSVGSGRGQIYGSTQYGR